VLNLSKSVADIGVGVPDRRSRGNGIANAVPAPNNKVTI